MRGIFPLLFIYIKDDLMNWGIYDIHHRRNFTSIEKGVDESEESES